MKRYILLASIITVILIITGCTNNNNSNETINNESTVSTEHSKSQEESDLDKSKIEETKELEALFHENNNLKKPDIEEARDFEASLKNGSVIMVTRNSSTEDEVYNISSLDNFIDSFNNGKECYVRVIKGAIENDGKIMVNKLEEYETDGKVIKSLPYDSYTDKNKFIPGNPTYSPKIVKTNSDNILRYSILQSKDTPDNMDATIISFDNSSIKN